ncbi:hypothetical protein F4819DRAFT_455393 [Hypoxylon fuscum]|nr:hypothetical protein F4819DRAFT_455393 [Hypoxylon fuscum]
MCVNYYSTKVYSCGKGEKQFVKFEPCPDKDKPGHTPTEGTLGSSRVKETCGAYNCPNH